MERLQKVIAASGVASRRKAEELIQAGRVSVNGLVVKELGTKVSGNDEIAVDGTVITKENKVYYLFNKPKHTICSTKDEHDRDTVLDYFSDVKERIFPVGRLDFDTTGLLILTNDGEVANKLMHPKSHLPKTYDVTIDGYITPQQINQLKKGVMLDDGLTLPAEVYLITQNKSKNKSRLQVTIFEGRNREVRRMMEHFNYEVTRLERITYGNLTCGSLRQGEYRRLRSFEVRELLKMIDQINQSSR